tara:strand:- start:2243 stop:2560 length:318 start_codon:yes stop_codon:yes gene_type:complete
MAKTYQYCVAENWGKGFITINNSIKMSPRNFPGNVWRIAANSQYSNKWVTAVNGVHKTLAEAQAIVDAEIQAAQAEWDAIPEDDLKKTEGSLDYQPRPINITLEE